MLYEADQLDDLRVVHKLYRFESFTLILISNVPWQAFDSENSRLDSRVQSLPEVQFSGYGDAELVSILEQRSNTGIQPGVVSNADLEYIANRSAGDARKAIALLYHSLRKLTIEGQSELTTSVIDRAQPDATSDIIRSRLSALSRQQRIILESISDVGPAMIGAIYE